MNKFKSDYPMRLFKHLSLPIVMASIVLLTFSACKNDEQVIVQPFKTVKDFDSKVVQDWQDLFLQIERYAAVYRPCPAARC
jgi:hypothetical protein